MPKKSLGENSKAVAARERKNEKASAEKLAKKQALEDEYWKDDNKQLAKKQAKKDEIEKKKLEALERKKERQNLVELEEKKLSSSKGNPVKVTQAKIREEAEKRELAAKNAACKKPEETHLSKPLDENINRIELESADARNVEDAISVLSLSNKQAVDKHPEKRMKAAYEEFENDRLPQLKAENPNMRLSQLKQMLRKEWQKSALNPLNKQLAAMHENN